MGEVMIKTLGLDQPEYQWMLDQVERDKEQELENRRIKAERLAMILEQQLKAEKAEAEAEAEQLEGGAGADSDPEDSDQEDYD